MNWYTIVIWRTVNGRAKNLAAFECRACDSHAAEDFGRSCMEGFDPLCGMKLYESRLELLNL